MGSARPRPKRLAEKLLAIRNRLGDDLSQNQFVRKLKLENEFGRERISQFERGVLEPPLHVLAAYAEAANVYVEVLIKDELDLPDKLPSQAKSEGVKRPD